MRYVIYVYINLTNNNMYVGYTKDLVNRNKRHCNDARYGSDCAFHRAIRKYGIDECSLLVVDESATKKEILEREKFWIYTLRTFSDYPDCQGYNLTEGGEEGVVSEEGRRKLSQAHSGPNNYMYGRTHTPEAREKIRKARLGCKSSKPLPQSHRVAQAETHSAEWEIIFPDGRTIVIRGLKPFCRQYGLCSSSMQQVARGLQQHHKGFKCRKLAVSKAERNLRSVTTRKVDHTPVRAYLFTPPYSEPFITLNLTAACREFNLPQSSMYLVKSGQRDNYRGFRCMEINLADYAGSYPVKEYPSVRKRARDNSPQWFTSTLGIVL